MYRSGVIVRTMMEKKSQQYKRKGGYGGEEGEGEHTELPRPIPGS
jgi:hypothetical protein